jgi:hypothetical protein
MKALISPIQENLIVQVEEDNKTFEVASPLYWLDCPNNIVAYQYQYLENQYVAYVPPAITAETNKQTATSLLQATDWTTIADVGNPAMSNPYLANQAEFIAYRNSVRQYAIYPVAGNIDWPIVPQEDWQTV